MQSTLVGAIWIGVAFVAVAIVVFSLRSLNKFKRGFSRRESRVPTSDSAFEAAFTKLAKIVAEDIGIPPDKLYPNDKLRSDLGYKQGNLDMDDPLDDIFEIVATATGVETEFFEGCTTLGEMSDRFCTRVKHTGQLS